ncbi:MAG: hypothetical protein COB15_02830 [Flavobacteriales bacterium]|nr:MAG: hypothetical protein COB15_02830 [Flavobacteriales bacterium]
MKLKLNKQTIATLSSNDMNHIHGGIGKTGLKLKWSNHRYDPDTNADNNGQTCQYSIDNPLNHPGTGCQPQPK